MRSWTRSSSVSGRPLLGLVKLGLEKSGMWRFKERPMKKKALSYLLDNVPLSLINVPFGSPKTKHLQFVLTISTCWLPESQVGSTCKCFQRVKQPLLLLKCMKHTRLSWTRQSLDWAPFLVLRWCESMYFSRKPVEQGIIQIQNLFVLGWASAFFSFLLRYQVLSSHGEAKSGSESSSFMHVFVKDWSENPLGERVQSSASIYHVQSNLGRSSAQCFVYQSVFTTGLARSARTPAAARWRCGCDPGPPGGRRAPNRCTASADRRSSGPSWRPPCRASMVWIKITLDAKQGKRVEKDPRSCLRTWSHEIM